MTFTELNTWLTEHQLFVLSIIIPALSALSAFGASWFSVRRAIRSEEQRRAQEAATQISVFRQAWINSLRDNLAEFQSIGMDPSSTPASERDFYRLGTKIELLMNPNDKDFHRLQSLMYEFLTLEEGETHEKYRLNPDFVEVSQSILKREWERLKRELRNPDEFISS